VTHEWMPISTAPKDGTVIILLAGKWLSGEWEVRSGTFLATRWPFVGSGMPTHWMPLPPPPES
jgi:hypothetical protein